MDEKALHEQRLNGDPVYFLLNAPLEKVRARVCSDFDLLAKKFHPEWTKQTRLCNIREKTFPHTDDIFVLRFFGIYQILHLQTEYAALYHPSLQMQWGYNHTQHLDAWLRHVRMMTESLKKHPVNIDNVVMCIRDFVIKAELAYAIK